MKLDVTDIFQDKAAGTTTFYLKGCPLRCPWCDRPQVRKPKKELLYDAESCIDCMVCFPECSFNAHDFMNGQHVVDRYKCVGCMACADACPAGALLPASHAMGVEAMLAQCQNTLILGGGEPLVQHEGVVALLQKAKDKDLCTCMETTGAFYPSQIPAVLPYVDRFVFRIIDTDPVRLKQHTGAKLEVLLNNLKAIDAAGKPTQLLCKLIPGVNMDENHAKGLAALYASLSCCEGIRLDPYTTSNPGKWKQLDLSPTQYSPADSDAVNAFADILRANGAAIIA